MHKFQRIILKYMHEGLIKHIVFRDELRIGVSDIQMLRVKHKFFK